MDKESSVCVAYHVFVYGIVQGVGYRYFVLQTAIYYKIVGWVRNVSDGSVEIHCEGGSISLQAFIKELWKGPRFSKVKNVKFSSKEIKKYTHFSIKN